MKDQKKDFNLTKLQGLKVLSGGVQVKKIYTQKNLCGSNTKYAAKTK